MVIRNGLVFESNGTFSRRDVYFDKEKILDAPADDTGSSNVLDNSDVIDATGLYVLPGLIDIHTHGAVGCDFSDGNPDGLMQIARYQKSQGITSFCPTSMTLPFEQLCDIFQTVLHVPDNPNAAHIAGINMEGPFLAVAKKGAHREEYIRNPSTTMLHQLNEACGGCIRLVTLAPEVTGASDFIRCFKDDIAISIGHSAANYDTAAAAFAAGANHVTHLFNAMNPFLHRDPGIIGAASDNENVMVEVICDGIHIHPSVIRNIFRIFGDDRVILISDSMRATGMEDGDYELGGQQVHKHGKHATLIDGTLAGSVTNLFDGVRNAVDFGIPLTSALKAATCNPAKSIGMAENIGSLNAGARSDILLVDEKLRLVQVV